MRRLRPWTPEDLTRIVGVGGLVLVGVILASGVVSLAHQGKPVPESMNLMLSGIIGGITGWLTQRREPATVTGAQSAGTVNMESEKP